MDYNQITKFLDKFKKTIFDDQVNREIIINTILKYIPKKIDESKIKIKGTIIYIQSSPILKNEILIHKKSILNDLSKTIQQRNFTDIR